MLCETDECIWPQPLLVRFIRIIDGLVCSWDNLLEAKCRNEGWVLLGGNFPEVSCTYVHLVSKDMIAFVLDYIFKDVCVVNC